MKRKRGGPSGKFKTGSKDALALANPSANDEQLRAHYQARLSIFAKASVAIFALLIVAINVMYAIAPELRPIGANQINGMALLAIAIYSALWFRMRRSKPTLAGLFLLDVVELLIVGTLIAASTWFSRDKTANLYSTLLYYTLLIFTRAAIVPSSGRRTFWLSLLAFIPLALVSLVVEIWAPEHTALASPFFFLGIVFYGLTSVVLATLASNVIYGLTKQLQEVEQLGQYTLLEKLGEGGMGVVYRGQHAMLRRPTAIKLLPIELVGEQSLRRFEQEVQRTSELTHPNTIVVYDYGRSPDGMFYYAMELLDGFDLEHLVERFGPQPVDRVIHILIQVCGALDEAHQKGLVHRDVKPANIFLCCRGDLCDFVKLLDFGLVTDFADLSAGKTQDFAGTPAYTSPEAVVDPKSVGPLSDVYAVGCVAYFLLTGQTVFQSKTAMAMCMDHVNTTPEPLTSRAEQTIADELDQLVMACLAKEGDKRPASAGELKGRLMGITQGDWSEAKSSQWWSDNEVAIEGVKSVQKHPGQLSETDPAKLTADLRGLSRMNTTPR